MIIVSYKILCIILHRYGNFTTLHCDFKIDCGKIKFILRTAGFLLQMNVDALYHIAFVCARSFLAQARNISCDPYRVHFGVI